MTILSNQVRCVILDYLEGIRFTSSTHVVNKVHVEFSAHGISKLYCGLYFFFFFSIIYVVCQQVYGMSACQHSAV